MILAADNSIPGVVGALLALLGAVFLLLLYRRQRIWRRAEDRFRVLVEKSSDATALLDPEGTIRYVSPSTVRVLGYTSEDLIGRSSFDLVHPDDLDLVRERLAQLLAHPERGALVAWRARHPASSRRWLPPPRDHRL